MILNVFMFRTQFFQVGLCCGAALPAVLSAVLSLSVSETATLLSLGCRPSCQAQSASLHAFSFSLSGVKERLPVLKGLADRLADSYAVLSYLQEEQLS